jgi:hypothetical protein
LIGHLFVPFHCGALNLSENGIAKLKELCGGEITQENWLRGECSSYEEPFEAATRIDRKRVYHRLPIWLVTLPSQTRLVPCLFASAASVDYRNDLLQIRESVIDGTYSSHIDRITPRFVATVGTGTEADGTYFWGEDSDNVFDPQYYVRCTESEVHVIGPRVGGRGIKAEVFDPGWFDDLPEWLQSRPIQKILRLTADSDVATAFALEPRIFPGRGYGEDTETYFRPAFPDPMGEYTTRLLQNTIAAYLLRNFIRRGDETIFAALKKDALAKAAGVKEFVHGEISKFEEAFDKLYGP